MRYIPVTKRNFWIQILHDPSYSPQERISWYHCENSLGDYDKSFGESSPGDNRNFLVKLLLVTKKKTLCETSPGDLQIYLLIIPPREYL